MNVKLKYLLGMSAALTLCAGCSTHSHPAVTVKPLPAERSIAPGIFAPTWESLAEHYQCPEWFRDAKFGIWAHWSAQSVPGQGDWYARNLYVQGTRQNIYHVEHYGHPSEFGFMEIDHLWRAEKWDPEQLMDLYVAAGAKYFVALANHEDNFDTYNSRYHAWNSVNVGPRRDIVGTWAKVARAHGLRFGVSNHSSHTWHWFQPAYGYDVEGPRAGVRYDAYRLTKENGRGKWWEGLDPQDLYGKPTFVIPDGFTSRTNARDWFEKANAWTEAAPTNHPAFADNWFFRLQDLLDQYQPDFLYLDNKGLPLGQAGLDIAAHFYNANMAQHDGHLEAVLTAKGLQDNQNLAAVRDWERSVPDAIQDHPFEYDTYIGDWHYLENAKYKTVGQVVQSLVDIVSKNGTMLLNIPQRGDGTIDASEVAFLKGMAEWIRVNGVAIYGTRPWFQFGEGPTKVPRGKAGDEELPYTQEDIRFTTKAGALYAFVMKLPSKTITIESLGLNAKPAGSIRNIELVGSNETIRWQQDSQALKIETPSKFPCENVIAFKIAFK